MKIIETNTLLQALGVKITRLKILAPAIAKKASPGQFIALMVSENGERIPLTIVESDIEKGTITLIVQEIGLSTKLLGAMKEGESLYSLVGPLGHATEIKNYGKIIVIGGGVGIAEIYPVARGFKAAGNRVEAILGARTKDLLILEGELRKVSDDVKIATDDGSYGRKGFVTDILKEAFTQHPASSAEYGLVYAVGPIPMMKAVSSVTKGFGVKTLVSLNALMVDATGMCGGCRVTVGGKVKFTCVDGPEFDAQGVDWEELEKRNRVYEDKEKHICKLKNIK
ncbi:MAG: sulfide/dihydroorotate dehydrogenase-like FAD/NAD-binding protein [Candidatus Omnitrophica bacterium]|nr:sulfide/dihydroorotate dehydrogenase-like FAD/NAD-binding protein [Candidatus Omnitrophota bacterium]MDD5429368.1 sulfide/dihydroorotate dehydrogenase-like FAD/NAD-binding protein [Candidatus Omnitrophota bacterium]